MRLVHDRKVVPRKEPLLECRFMRMFVAPLAGMQRRVVDAIARAVRLALDFELGGAVRGYAAWTVVFLNVRFLLLYNSYALSVIPFSFR
jgi:hypothetical protein